MSRNAESHFAQIPTESMQRSVMSRDFTLTTTHNIADVIPIFWDYTIMPGDTVAIKHSKVVRLQTLLTPIFGNIVYDVYFFFIPWRLVWTHFKEFMGENTQSAWIPQATYTVPTISAPATTGFTTGSLADYFGYPVGVPWTNAMKHAPSALPFRCYATVMDSFFRDENLTDPLNIPTGDSNQTGTNGSNYINDVANGGAPFKAAKLHDAFTSALPGPQKGPDVKFPLISGTQAEVYAGSIHQKDHNDSGLVWTNADNNTTTFTINRHILNGPASDNHYAHTMVQNESTSVAAVSNLHLTPANLWADLSSTVGAVTVNQMRLAFQLQKYYEKLARGGSRYTEIIKQMFSVTSPDARLQRPEYLGGNRINLTVHEVANTAQTQSDFLGDLGAMSRTADSHWDFEKSFTEHGMILGVAVARISGRQYAQGIDPMLLRKTQESWYLPVFAHIGEQPIPKCTIYADTTTMDSDDVFGYQEAWYDYRYAGSGDRVTGEMRPGIQNSLATWNLADYYTQAPTLSDSWIREDKSIVDRTLAVTSQVSNQILADFYFDCKYTRVMPVYSVPGLIDHF